MTAIRAFIDQDARNGMPPPGEYVYRGTKVELGLDLHAVNQQILRERPQGSAGPAPRDGRPGVTLPGTCRKGHPYTPANTYIQPDGQRRCRTCKKAIQTRSQRRVSRR